MKWTAIEDSKPRNGAKVLLWMNGRVITGYRNIIYFGGFATYRESGHCIDGATHWAPFPKPPVRSGGSDG